MSRVTAFRPRPIIGPSASSRDLLADLFRTGVEAASGTKAVGDSYSLSSFQRPSAVLAVGKAAYQMHAGLPECERSQLPSLIVTKHNHVPSGVCDGDNVRIIESSHPIPTEQSLSAGQAVLDFVRGLGPDDRLLVLVSGGASSLVEVLSDGIQLKELQSLTLASMADGSDIETINRRRQEISQIKGGGLLTHFQGRSVDVLAISDVEGDDIAVIGSGIGHKAAGEFEYDSHIVGSNAQARAAVARKATELGLTVQINRENLYGDILDISSEIIETCVAGRDGIYIFGGEPTVQLPENPGYGGRNQSLALMIAHLIQGRQDLTCLVAGTDGTDGVTDAAGAIVDGSSFSRVKGGDDALSGADAGTFLSATGDQYVTGPTGTNVMDLLLVHKRSA